MMAGHDIIVNDYIHPFRVTVPVKFSIICETRKVTQFALVNYY